MAAPTSPPKWAYTPELPLRTSPLASRPIRPRAAARSLALGWRPLSGRAVILAVSLAVWVWFSPDLELAATLNPGWVVGILVRNYAVVLLAAGLTHLWLYTWHRQGERLRYDSRPLSRARRVFLFGDQVRDNMFHTLVLAVPIGTAWEVVMWWSYANGFNLWGGVVTWSGGWGQRLWMIALLVLIPIYSVNHFAVVHWVLHRGVLYRRIHSVHHRNVNVTPWSGLAMHPLEHVVLFADVWLFGLIPSSPLHMIFAIMHHFVGAPLSHTGYDGIEVGRGRTLAIGDFHHQLHHRFIECNYGGLESALDDRLDSFHDGTPDGERHVAQRRRRLAADRRRSVEGATSPT